MNLEASKSTTMDKQAINSDEIDLTKKNSINKTLAIAVPLILVVLAGVALSTTIVILATKTSVFKSSAKIIQNCSKNILGCSQNATSSASLESLGSVNQELLDESLQLLWNSIKLENPKLLKDISLSNAQEIRRWLNDPINKRIINSITTIDLSSATLGVKLKIIPPEIGLFKKLKFLDIYWSDITFLPKEIGKLSSLESLTIVGASNLTALPKEIGRLTSLKYLTVSGTQIASLPKEMGRLSSLKGLYLSNNQLISLPKEMGKLTSLEYLYLNYNKIDGVPQGMVHLLESNGGKLIVYNNGKTFK